MRSIGRKREMNATEEMDIWIVFWNFNSQNKEHESSQLDCTSTVCAVESLKEQSCGDPDWQTEWESTRNNYRTATYFQNNVYELMDQARVLYPFFSLYIFHLHSCSSLNYYLKCNLCPFFMYKSVHVAYMPRSLKSGRPFIRYLTAN